MDKIQSVAEILGSTQKLVVLTGAGVSKESGIPTFRDAQTGLWADFNPQELATPQAFLRNPPLVWKWYDWRRQKVAEVQPNPGHFALVELEKHLPEVVVITQNVDGLHTLAGSSHVIELHGNIRRIKCFDGGHMAENVAPGLEEPPKCSCGSMLRPDVVWFGEALPERELHDAFRHSESCDTMFVVGTSAVVYPAASLPQMARKAGARIVEINPEPTDLTALVDSYLQGPSGEILPSIVTALRSAKRVV